MRMRMRMKKKQSLIRQLKNVLLLSITIGILAGCSKINVPGLSPKVGDNGQFTTLNQLKYPSDKTTSSTSEFGSILINSFSGIYKEDLSTREILPLNNVQDNVVSDVSVIGDEIYYFQTTSGPLGIMNNEIYSMTVKGEKIKKITDDISWKYFLAPSPDKKNLIYTTVGDEEENRLILLHVGDMKSRIVTKGSDKFFYPTWSPDSKKVVYFVSDGEVDTGKLYLYDLENQQIDRLLPDNQVLLSQLAWSPDGKAIVLGMVRNDIPGIYLLDVDSRTIQNIIDLDFSPGNFQWAPDGKKVLFESVYFSENEEPGLFSLNLFSKKISNLKSGGLEGIYYSYQAQWFDDSEHVGYLLGNGSQWSIVIQNIVNNYSMKVASDLDGFLAQSWKIIR